MIPIISRMMYKNKRVELYYLSAAAPKHVDITSFVHSSEDLLSFLNVEVKSYVIDDYVTKSLIFIYDWHKKFGASNHYLGTSWLRSQFVKTFAITVNTSSELLEKLKVDELIYDDKKHLTDGEVKTTVKLTDKGLSIIGDVLEKVASTKTP